MAGLTAYVANLSYDLNDGEEIRLLDYDLGLAAIRRLSQRSPGQHGDSDMGYRFEPRYLDLFWAIHGSSAANYWAIRERMMTVFQPRDNDAVQLVFDLDGILRAIDVNLEGEMLFRDRIALVEMVSGTFKAPDPRLYDPAIKTLLFSLEAGGVAPTGWPIPWPIPWAVGSDVLNMAIDVPYAGLSRLGAPEYPVIRLFGPIDAPIITNETTGEVIDLTDNGGLSLADPTEWIQIDLANPPRRDAKTILDQDGNSAEQYLTTASDFATFHLAPAGERLYDGSYCTGTNTLRVFGTGVTSETLATINYYDRYQGA
jgi:hypothetical protein